MTFVVLMSVDYGVVGILFRRAFYNRVGTEAKERDQSTLAERCTKLWEAHNAVLLIPSFKPTQDGRVMTSFHHLHVGIFSLYCYIDK